MKKIYNWINGKEKKPESDQYFKKFNPHNGNELSLISRSNEKDVNYALTCARKAYPLWREITPVKRGEKLTSFIDLIKENKELLAKSVATETGKSFNSALGEVNGSIKLGEFFAGEGMRLYGRSLNSGMAGKQSFTIRESIGVSALIVPANTPIANICWKIFPSLICGNSVILKASEDSPEIALLIARLATDAGMLDGVLNVLQGYGNECGSHLVKSEKVDLISFTGSTETGKLINKIVSEKLTKISLELGGKNPFIVCNDADIQNAIHWALLSSFSNAGQRCAASSRIIVYENIYADFVDKFVNSAMNLKLGIENNDDLGPLISKKQLDKVFSYVDKAVNDGGLILCGGNEQSSKIKGDGYYYLPTIIENLDIKSDFCQHEIFGPVVSIHKVKSDQEALVLANSTNYGLTSAVHTTNINTALWFTRNIVAGVVNVNLPTFGSEPHMPFGGFKLSGNGTREPGSEAIDFYSELKNISLYSYI
jgi:alpha-ketoglutaric semialdehyde dehydrogenase